MCYLNSCNHSPNPDDRSVGEIFTNSPIPPARPTVPKTRRKTRRKTPTFYRASKTILQSPPENRTTSSQTPTLSTAPNDKTTSSEIPTISNDRTTSGEIPILSPTPDTRTFLRDISTLNTSPPPPGDSTILHEISALNTLIQGHAGNFYHSEAVEGKEEVDNLVTRVIGIRRVVARQIIDYMSRVDDDVSERGYMENLDELKSYLRPHTYNNCIDDRDEHLRALFEHGAWIKSLIRSHPAEWSFGDISVWPTDSTQAVAFPSISKRGLIVREQELVSL